MKKILFLAFLSVFLASCSVKFKNTNNTGYNYLQPHIISLSNKGHQASVNLDSVDSDRLNNNYILYESNGAYNYFAYSKWINSPPTMLRDFILESINYIKLDNFAKYRLKILLFNYEPHFSSKGNVFYFKARAFLYNSKYEILSSKVFEYKENFQKNTNQAMLESASKATQEFMEQLSKWLLGEIK